MKRTVDAMALTVVLVASLCLSSCGEPLVDTPFSYRCDLSSSGVDVNRDFAWRFASRLAAVANLRGAESEARVLIGSINGGIPITGYPSLIAGLQGADTPYVVELKSNAAKDLTTRVICEPNSKKVAVIITGSTTESAEAEMIGKKAMAIFSELVPGQKLTPFIFRQGWFGP